MNSFEATPRKWGNSLGITIPKEIVDGQQLSADTPVRVFLMNEDTGDLRKIFGTFKTKKSTDELLKEADKGWPSDW